MTLPHVCFQLSASEMHPIKSTYCMEAGHPSLVLWKSVFQCQPMGMADTMANSNACLHGNHSKNTRLERLEEILDIKYSNN